jgi:hypothetical protein
MKMFSYGAVLSFLAATTLLAAPAFSADAVPCEKMLADVRDALKTAQLSEGDKAKVAELESKGTERCNADDDTRADQFFAEALKLMGK